MRWAVLVGGAGSNLRAILASGFPVSLVVSHRAGVGALAIAQEHGIPHHTLLPRAFPDRFAYDRALVNLLRAHSIQRIALAGFLRWLTADVIQQYPGAIVNLHPSLLPLYPGLHAIERAYADRVLWSGVTVHFVDEGHDTGPVIAQAPVPRYLSDTLETFADRIHQAEHRLFPRVLWALDAQEVWLDGGQVCYAKEDDQWMYGRS
ncbi:MAG: phosphoribosylglycinamide formyltransferase [Firmicutes bacterium]|nr:phosphoribosylglycinamide formyltransferase [Bacillota bacterium]